MQPSTSLRSQPQALSQDAVRAVLQSHGEPHLTVVSDSMRPLMRKGDVVLVRAIPGSDIQVGDVVLLQVGDQMVSHRLIGMRGHFVQTKGDAALGMDPPVQTDRLLGVVRVVYRDKLEIDLSLPTWQRISRLVAIIGLWESGLWHILHPGTPVGSLRNLLDMINWLLRIPMRSATYGMVYFQLRLKTL